MRIITVTEPPAEIVSINQVYDHLRLEPFGSPPEHPDETLLTRLIKTSRIQAEQITKRSFVKQRLRTTFPTIVAGSYIELLRPPFIVMERVQYYDTDNAVQTLSPANYYVNTTSSIVPRLQFNIDMTVPALYDREDAVIVDWWAGYPPVDSPESDYIGNVPSPLKDAVLFLIQQKYDNFDESGQAVIENAIMSLLDPYVVQTFK